MELNEKQDKLTKVYMNFKDKGIVTPSEVNNLQGVILFECDAETASRFEKMTEIEKFRTYVDMIKKRLKLTPSGSVEYSFQIE